MGGGARNAVSEAFCTPAKLPVNMPRIFPKGSLGNASAGTMVSSIVPETFWQILATCASRSDGAALRVRTDAANITRTLTCIVISLQKKLSLICDRQVTPGK